MEANIFELTDTERESFKQELKNIDYDPQGHCSYINDLRLIAMKSLPSRLLRFLIKQKASLTPHPYFIVKNVPTDDEVYQVPHEYELESDPRNSKSSSVSENLLMAIASTIGEPYSISFEGESIVNNLIPSQEKKRDFTGLGSEVELDFHIENAALKYLDGRNFSPMGLMLTGVHRDPLGPGTLVADGREALKNLPTTVKNILRQNRFILKVPYRWREALYTEFETAPVPIIKEDYDFPDLAVAFYGDIARGTDPEAQLALSLFYNEIKNVAKRIEINPGTLVYIDNRFALHSRESFVPTFDGENRALRWIQRVFISTHLWSHRNLAREKHRVFNPAKSQRRVS